MANSDLKRWSTLKSFHKTWEERTYILARKIPKDAIVLEFGAGRQILRDQLPKGCTYLHSDIVKRDKDTIVVDLNKELPEFPKVDVMIFSGVLEYIYDVEKILAHCSKYSNQILMSYAVQDKCRNIDKRRHHGWISDLSHKNVVDIAKNINMSCNKFDVWRDQYLYHLRQQL